MKTLEDKLYRCRKCNMLTDGVDDGVIGHGRPENNASNKEEFEMREEQRRQRRLDRLRRPRGLR